MIDIHCHLLYGVDDGPKKIEESIQMLKEAKSQGISAIILTPHYRHGMFQYPLDEIMEHYKKLEPYASELNVKLYLGCEFHVHSRIAKYLQTGRCLTMAESSYVLTEYSYDTSYETIYQMTSSLMMKGYIPSLPMWNAIRYWQRILPISRSCGSWEHGFRSMQMPYLEKKAIIPRSCVRSC